MSNPTCEYCRFWKPLDKDAEDKDMEETMEDGLGRCHRNPPFLDPDFGQPGDIGTYGVWPLTLTTDWCGEFKEARFGVALDG